MSRDTVIFNFRKGFEPLKEAFEANGYRVAENEWAPAPQLAARCEAAVVNLYEAIRRPWNATRRTMGRVMSGWNGAANTRLTTRRIPSWWREVVASGSVIRRRRAVAGQVADVA